MKTPSAAAEVARVQNIVQHHAPQEYYRKKYRGMESHYLPGVWDRIRGLAPGRALDIGPGYGTLGVLLAEAGWKVHLLDCVPLGKFLMSTLTGAYKMHFHQGSIETGENVPPLQADLVAMTMVFGHLRYRPDEAIRNASAMLAPGGTFICCNIDHAHTPIGSHYAHWRDMPLPGQRHPVPDEVTCTFEEFEYRDLLGLCFEEVSTWASSGILYGIARRPAP